MSTITSVPGLRVGHATDPDARTGCTVVLGPFRAACDVRGLATGAWGWQRDGSGEHVGPLYWETVQSAAALVSVNLR